MMMNQYNRLQRISGLSLETISIRKSKVNIKLIIKVKASNKLTRKTFALLVKNLSQMLLIVAIHLLNLKNKLNHVIGHSKYKNNQLILKLITHLMSYPNRLMNSFKLKTSLKKFLENCIIS